MEENNKINYVQVYVALKKWENFRTCYNASLTNCKKVKLFQIYKSPSTGKYKQCN